LTKGGINELTVDHSILHLGNEVENSDTTDNEGTGGAEDRSVEFAKTEHVD
jgi:hypothetical protein